MANRRSLHSWFVLGLICLFGMVSVHLVGHTHDHGTDQGSCPLCHSSIVEALPAPVILLAGVVVVICRRLLLQFVVSYNLVLAKATQRRAPPPAV